MAFTKITAAGIGSTETVTLDGLSVINNGSFGGNLTVSGVLTYEDVTNVDSVGVITARAGVLVGSGITLSKDGDIFATGVSTVTTLKVGSGVTVSSDGDVFFTGIATGNGSGLTALNASNLGSGTVPTARLGSGTASSSTFLRGDSTFQTVNTDLVSDTSPQLGGLLDGNGNTANFTANTTGLGLPRGTTAQQPTASSYEGYIRYDNDDNVVYYSDGSNWIKIAAAIPSLTSVTGNIFAGSATTLTLAGTNFLTANLVVNFSQSSDSIDVNVTVTPSSQTAATVDVPSSVYSNVTAGNVVAIKVTNSDNVASGTVNKTAVSLPTGGTISTYSSGGNDYRVHTFTSSGNFVATYALSNVDYVMVAGGGAGGGEGGYNGNGGGGAGGYLQSQFGSMSAATYAVVIGGGGTGSANNSGQTSGSNTTFNSLTAIGGGHGQSAGEAAESGGSGGGGTSMNSVNAAGTSGQGNDGGNGHPDSRGGGGGGGAGAVEVTQVVLVTQTVMLVLVVLVVLIQYKQVLHKLMLVVAVALWQTKMHEMVLVALVEEVKVLAKVETQLLLQAQPTLEEVEVLVVTVLVLMVVLELLL